MQDFKWGKGIEIFRKESNPSLLSSSCQTWPCWFCLYLILGPLVGIGLILLLLQQNLYDQFENKMRNPVDRKLELWVKLLPNLDRINETMQDWKRMNRGKGCAESFRVSEQVYK